MAINFPNSPTVGEEYTAGGFTWTWTGSAWEKVSATTAAANDFVLLVGATGNTTYVLDRTYTAGRYAIDFVNDDTTYDIYFIAEDGTYAGYTNNAVAVVTADFSEVVVLGAATNETILFTYQGTATAPSTAGDVATAGAFINSVVTSSLPNIDDTTVVNGGNFAANVQVHFIGQNAAVTAAKTVVRTSSAQLVVTRPDSFAVAQSPYTVRVTNPGIPVPAGSNAHLLNNAVTAGTNPVWVTGTTIVYNVGAATNITLLATDTEASDIDYTLVSGTLPTGLTLDEETGVISGTFSGSANEGDVTSITVRATDAGGNFLDRTFSLTANTAPTWTTAAGALTNALQNSAYSFQLIASTGTFGGTLTYSLQSGSLLTGLTLSSTGLISGTPTSSAGTNASFTVRVTDQAGLFTDRAFTIMVATPALTSSIRTTRSTALADSFLTSAGFAVTSNGSTYATFARASRSDNADGGWLAIRSANGTLQYSERILHSNTSLNNAIVPRGITTTPSDKFIAVFDLTDNTNTEKTSMGLIMREPNGSIIKSGNVPAANIGGGNNDDYNPYYVTSFYSTALAKEVLVVAGDYTFGQRCIFMQTFDATPNQVNFQSLGGRVLRANTPSVQYSGMKGGGDLNRIGEKLLTVSTGWNGESFLHWFSLSGSVLAEVQRPVTVGGNWFLMVASWDAQDRAVVITENNEIVQYSSNGTFISGSNSRIAIAGNSTIQCRDMKIIGNDLYLVHNHPSGSNFGFVLSKVDLTTMNPIFCKRFTVSPTSQGLNIKSLAETNENIVLTGNVENNGFTKTATWILSKDGNANGNYTIDGTTFTITNDTFQYVTSSFADTRASISYVNNSNALNSASNGGPFNTSLNPTLDNDSATTIS